MRNARKTQLAAAIALAAVASSAIAQSGYVREGYSSPLERDGSAGFRLGDSPFYVKPLASIGYGNDSNTTLANTNVISSSTQTYKAGLKADARTSQTVFLMDILATRANYSDSREDNYTDAGVKAGWDFALDVRNRTRINLDYLRGHDPRGSTDRAISNSVDKYDSWTPGFIYAYGADGARGRIEAFAKQDSIRYRNNPTAQADSDRDNLQFGAAFYARVAPKTSVVIEARGNDIKYRTAKTADATEARYLIGLAWQATALTSGSLKVGRLERKNDLSGKSSDGTYEGSITWAPRTYSTVTLTGSRQTQESTGVGSFILSDATRLNWAHQWSSTVSTGVNAGVTKDRYQDFARTDDTTSFGVNGTYRFRPWLSLGLAYQYAKRESSIRTNDYDKNTWLVTADFSL